jgi:tight adherence protein C
MLVQTDRFGTSIADALRIHADELRTKRRQRAEERAAKLTVKLLIPILLFIFPSMFIVMLGPALCSTLRRFAGRVGSAMRRSGEWRTCRSNRGRRWEIGRRGRRGGRA